MSNEYWYIATTWVCKRRLSDGTIRSINEPLYAASLIDENPVDLFVTIERAYAKWENSPLPKEHEYDTFNHLTEIRFALPATREQYDAWATRGETQDALRNDSTQE